jgi:hypothetical protein
MTLPQVDYKSFYLVYAARSECARCEKRSPVVWFRRPKSGGQKYMRDYKVRGQIAEELAAEGWELDIHRDKAFCPICKGIGK